MNLFVSTRDVFWRITYRCPQSPTPSRISGPTFVPHEWSRSDQQQPTFPAAVVVSPLLCSLVADRRFMFAADLVYRHPACSSLCSCCSVVWSRIQDRHRPPTSPHGLQHHVATPTSLGLLSVCSVRRKAALIHDVIADNHLDVLVMTETASS